MGVTVSSLQYKAAEEEKACLLRWLSRILFSARPSFSQNQPAWTTWIVAAKHRIWGQGSRVPVALGLGCLGR